MTHDEVFEVAKKVAGVRIAHNDAATAEIESLTKDLGQADRVEAIQIANAIAMRPRPTVSPVGPVLSSGSQV